jgi:hypothetical protein
MATLIHWLAAVRSWIIRAASQATAPASSDDKKEPSTTSDNKEKATTDTAEDASQAKPARDAIAALRTDLAGYGTAIGAISTVLIGSTAVLNLAELFPLPPDATEKAMWAAVALIAAAVIGPALLTRRFFSARRRILIDTMEYRRGPLAAPTQRLGERIKLWSALRVRHRTSHLAWPPRPQPSRAGGLSSAERRLVQTRFAELANEEGATDIVSLENRSERLARIASRAKRSGDTETATSAQAEADRLAAGLDAAIAQAALLVIERRSAKVYRGMATVVFTLLGLFGTVGIIGITEWSHGERERNTAWVDCQKAFPDEKQQQLRVDTCEPLKPEAKR